MIVDEDRAKIARTLAAMCRQQQALSEIPRMAQAVVADGEVIAFAGHGATADTMFRIASMTKSFTAAATLLLRDDGLLELDRPVGSYAPELAILRGPFSDDPPITLRQLLTMTSGLATDDPWADRHLDVTDDELDAIVEAGPLFATSPGTAFEYSNLGYALIGRVLHRVSGARPQQLITERLLRPLGMEHTVWDAEVAPPGSDLALGVRTDAVTEETRPGDGVLAPMGGLWSNVADLAKWVAFFTDAFPARDAEDPGPLRRSSRREMQRVHTVVPLRSAVASDGGVIGFDNGYGMGLLLNRHAELGEFAGHAGGLPGYGSIMRWIKHGHLGVIALANKTYAPMWIDSWRTFDALAAAKVARRPTVPVAPLLQKAGEALFGLLTTWTDERAVTVFSDNVDCDDPLLERATAAESFNARFGPFRFARIEASKLTSGTLILQGPEHEFAVPFSLAPLASGRIQAYTLPGEP